MELPVAASEFIITFSPHSSVNLVIQVADLNDNPPSFVGSPYTATRSEVRCTNISLSG